MVYWKVFPKSCITSPLTWFWMRTFLSAPGVWASSLHSSICARLQHMCNCSCLQHFWSLEISYREIPNARIQSVYNYIIAILISFSEDGHGFLLQYSYIVKCNRLYGRRVTKKIRAYGISFWGSGYQWKAVDNRIVVRMLTANYDDLPLNWVLHVTYELC